VCALKMLLATPYLPFDGVSGNNGPPRVISEIRKSSPVIIPREQIRPRISGDLLVICANEKRWWPRRVMVRGGQLLVGSAPGEGTPGGLRLPLRHLSLAAGPLPNSLALYKGQNIVLTLQTASERAFDLWVKTIAIELIRQTPLEAVKYLDILTLADCWTRKKQEDCEKDWNFNYVKETTHPQCNFCTSLPPKTKIEAPKLQPPQHPPPPPPPLQHDEKNIEVLIKRCQNSENYVPVKDKLVLFESLCRLGRKVRSTEDVSVKINMEATKRAVSMHDLSNCTTGVRQICKYFENKTDQRESDKFATIHRPNRRLIHSDSQLHSVQNMYRYNREFQNVSSV